MWPAALKPFTQLSVWSRGDQRAPHKPLLVLYALGRFQRGEPVEVPFREVAPALTDLLREFGPPRKSFHPEYPFWRLKNDGVWFVRSDGDPTPRRSNSDPPKSELLTRNSRGAFASDVLAALRADPSFVGEIARTLLANHFPESIHADILAAVGLDLTESATRSGTYRRDPRFRDRVLIAYEYRCAVCGFDVRLGSVTVALDAAHVRWYQAGGPDTTDNGLALCVLHHKLFDLGAFTIDAGHSLFVSDRAVGSDGFAEALMRFHSKRVRTPQRSEWRPAAPFLDWHAREVFKGERRHAG